MRRLERGALRRYDGRMRLGEVVKALRFVRDVLVEYVATKKQKREVAARRAAEAGDVALRRPRRPPRGRPS